ncbi:MAG: hypothetical protein WD048_09050 [Chitinophagales bacterium]
MRKTNAGLFWSGGKDAALSYWKCTKQNQYAIKALITTVTEKDEVAMHAVPMDIIREQAEQMDIPLLEMKLPEFSSNKVYEQAFVDICQKAKSQYKIDTLLFGDIYLEDVKAFREKMVADCGLKADFPIWGQSPDLLYDELLEAKIKAKTIVVDASVLDKSWLGRDLDASFKTDYPAGHDLCGEDGAYHSLVYDAPFFKSEIELPKSKIIKKTLNTGRQNQEYYFMVFT